MAKQPTSQRKPSSVRHTRSNQEARRQKQPPPPPDEITAQRIKEVIHPATLTQIRYYHDLGLRERVLTLPLMVAVVISLIWRQFASVSEALWVLTLPLMVAVVISLIWRQFASVSEALRVLKEEGLLWAEPVEVSQQALSERLRTLPSSLFERIVQDTLPQMQTNWQARHRPLPPEIVWALDHYQQVVAVDGSTLDSLLRRVGLLRDQDKAPLAGRMMALLDVASRLPTHLWSTHDSRANDQRFWPEIFDVLRAGTLLLLDLGFTNYDYYAKLTAQQVTFITRCKTNAVFSVKQVFHRSAHLHDCLIELNSEPLRLRLILVQYQGRWYRYLTNELDPAKLPPLYVIALYWQRWRVEDAFKTVKRLLGLAYFWVGSENGVALQLWATWLMYAVLVDLADEVADTLGVPFADISVEMIYRSLYFCVMATHRGETDNPVAFLAAKAKLFGLIKRQRKPSAFAQLKLTISADP